MNHDETDGVDERERDERARHGDPRAAEGTDPHAGQSDDPRVDPTPDRRHTG